MSRGVSPIYHRGPRDGYDALARNHATRARLWHDLGVIVIHPDQIENDWTRQALVNEANRLFGKKGQ